MTRSEANKHNKIPETKNVEAGSSRRNITRRNDGSDHQRKNKKQGGGGGVGGKGDWREIDDGSL
eukprot:CAMPEP_0201685420 /NCGR_PEP_ID=MMETSP0578-20130828/162_1 /ASSEMBLY_ACC=CAM_ASM_000663 /TAXON_ID=267565 /ORGANISM="Skeletonema grethea, Strain CCMP 1804" /LENGTH=63 /DNA_ID=CAMNT_0048169297 /DNA_START=225 /DNA_END=416 /DNA_ORIENTATION=-